MNQYPRTTTMKTARDVQLNTGRLIPAGTPVSLVEEAAGGRHVIVDVAGMRAVLDASEVDRRSA